MAKQAQLDGMTNEIARLVKQIYWLKFKDLQARILIWGEFFHKIILVIGLLGLKLRDLLTQEHRFNKSNLLNLGDIRK